MYICHVYLVSFLFDAWKGCKFSDDSLGTSLWPPTSNVSCANGSHLWNCFQQETRNTIAREREREGETATQRITTLTNMAELDAGRHADACIIWWRQWAKREIVTSLSSFFFFDYGSCQMWSRMSARLGIVWRAIKAKRWAVNPQPKWVVKVLLESVKPQTSGERKRKRESVIRS